MSDPTLGTATLRTRVDTAGLQTGLARAEQDVNRFGTAAGSRLANAARVGATAVAGITTAAAAAGAALIATANRAAQYADEVDKAALRTRLSTDTVQELRFVTDQLGGSFATIETAVQGFTMRLAGAEQGGERQIDAFNRLGISVRDASGELRSQEELLFSSLAALSAVSNETEQAVLAQELFGRSAAQLGPLLNAGSGAIEEYRQKARDLGLVLDRESVTSLVAYKDQLSAVQQQFGAVTRDLALGFLPLLTDTLLPAVQGAVDAFRRLPEPLQRSAAGLTALGVGGTAAAAALRALGVSTAALFGPAGLIIAGVTTIGVLAASLAGGRNSLSAAVNDAQAALASGDKGSFLNALDRIIDRTDAGARPALERLRSDLIQTGNVGVEQAARIIAAVEQFSLQNRKIFGIETRGQLELQLTLIGNRVGEDFVTAYESAIDRLDFEGAAVVLERAIEGAIATGVRRGDLERIQPVLTDLREFIAGLAELPTAFRDPGYGTGAASTAGAGGSFTGGSALAARAERTLQDVFTDLGAAGLRAVEASQRLITSGVNESEATAAQLRTRLRLLEDARAELLRDFYDEVTDAQLAYLQERITSVQGQLDRVLAGAPAAGTPPAAVTRGALAADAAAIRADTQTAVALAAAAERAERVQYWLDRAATNAENQSSALAINADTQAAITTAAEDERQARLAGWRAQIAVNAELEAQAAAIRADTAAAQAPRGIPSPQAVVSVAPARDIAQPGVSVAVDQEALALVRAREAREEERAQRIARVNFRAAEAYRLSGENLLAFTQRVINDPRSPTVPIPVPEAIIDVGNAAAPISEAAIQFRDTVILAGAQFATGLAQSIRDGNIGSAFQSALGLGGQLAGAAGNYLSAGGALLGLGAGAVPGLNLVAGLLPILGSLVGGFLPGSRAREEQERAAASRARAVPSIRITAEVNQTNYLTEGINSPSTQASLDQRIQNAIRSAFQEIGLAEIRAAAFGSAT